MIKLRKYIDEINSINLSCANVFVDWKYFSCERCAHGPFVLLFCTNKTMYIFISLRHFRPLPLLHLSTVGKKHRFCNLVETSFQRVYQGQFQSRRIAERADV